MESRTRYIIMAVMAIITVVVLVVIFNIVRGVFDGGDSPGGDEAGQNRPFDLREAAGSGQPVRHTIRGSVVGDEEHRSIRITIDESSRELQVLQGFSDNVIRTERFYNTQDAYNSFAAAINGAGFAMSIPPEGRGDEAQVCPLGRHFVYEAAPGMSGSFRAWSTSCLRSEGTFGGNADLVRQLFQLQIPGYSQLTDNVQLNR